MGKTDIAAEILAEEELAKYARDGTAIFFLTGPREGSLRNNPKNERRREDGTIIIYGLLPPSQASTIPISRPTER